MTTRIYQSRCRNGKKDSPSIRFSVPEYMKMRSLLLFAEAKMFLRRAVDFVLWRHHRFLNADSIDVDEITTHLNFLLFQKSTHHPGQSSWRSPKQSGFTISHTDFFRDPRGDGSDFSAFHIRIFRTNPDFASGLFRRSPR